MPHHLEVIVRFLTDRYHGADWPPSPARLFQALVAGAKTGVASKEWGADEETALEWLEGLGPPEIFARRQKAGRTYTMFVPNNSLDKGVQTKTSKAVAPRILVNHVLGEPDVVYRWRIEDESVASAHVVVLDRVASRLRALGWGVDFATATVHITDQGESGKDLEHYTPDARGGTGLRIPKAGLLSHLDECHRAFQGRISRDGINPYTRPTQFGVARYRVAQLSRPRRWIGFDMEALDGGPFAYHLRGAQTIAAWMRHAAGEALKEEELNQEWINSYVLGHTAKSDLGKRLSFVPLPSIGHAHSDGAVRRVAIVEPPSATAEDREALDLLHVKLGGWVLTEERGRHSAILTRFRDETKVLPYYMRKAKTWMSVTPVVLHGYNSTRGRISLTKTDRLLCQAFESAGFPEGGIDDITFQNAPYWAGGEGAMSIRMPRHLVQWPRVHVRVEFREATEGPVLAGIGRHYGIGVFAAEPEN